MNRRVSTKYSQFFLNPLRQRPPDAELCGASRLAVEVDRMIISKASEMIIRSSILSHSYESICAIRLPG
jgi:hypothetical protein